MPSWTTSNPCAGRCRQTRKQRHNPRHKYRAAGFAIIALILAPTARSANERTESIVGHVAEVIDGDSLRLTDGREVSLTGIEAPHMSAEISRTLDGYGGAKWPSADEAKEALEDLAHNARIEIVPETSATDRYDRLVGQAYRDDGIWLQGEMIKNGFARVRSVASNTACLGVLLALERQARADNRGIWTQPFYRIRTPGETVRDIDTFQIVEGTIASAANIGGRIYLNFGDDYRHDFTATIQPEQAPNFDFEDVTVKTGHKVRLRGWISLYNGPNLHLTHPAQIEWLDTGEKGRGKSVDETSPDADCLERPVSPGSE